MDKQIKISVIIPVYKAEKYIGKCVESLMKQTLDEVEYIFVDDFTPDASVIIAKEIIDRYPQRRKFVKWIHHPQNKGVATARNSGLAAAVGKYIYYCDSDDYLDIRMLEKLLKKAEDENLDFVWCDFYMETLNGIFEEKTASCCDDKATTLKKYIAYGWNSPCNTICRRDVYEKNGIKSMTSISFCEDFELMTKLFICSNSWGKVDEPLYHYNRQNIGSIVTTSLNNGKLMKTIEDGIAAISSVCNFTIKYNPVLYRQLEKELNWRMLKAKTYLFFFPTKRQYYLSLRPECNKDIDSNPLCSRFQKSMQKLIISPFTAPIVWAFGALFRLRAIVK